MYEFTALPPLSLYVHLPWCVRKCPYCDFNSHAVHGELPEDQYIRALLADLEYDLPRVWGRRVQTVFLGGGTPSLFSPAAIEHLLAGIRARLPLAPGAEITLEANPGTVEQDRFRGYRQAGVNRLSIGIQSFDNDRLAALGRIHGRDAALAAAEAARAAGFDNINLDLMFGLPGQTPEAAYTDLAIAIAQQPAHLSVYQLTLEPNTPFHARPPALPDDDVVAAMQETLGALLAAHGYQQYEVSANAQAGRQCRHNLNYWQFGDYLGIGAGAHAKLTDPHGITRLWKRKQPQDYLTHAGSSAALGGEMRILADDIVFEFMLNALRLTDGFSPGLFTERTGLPWSRIQSPIDQAVTAGLLEDSAHVCRPTNRGRLFLNNLIAHFLPADEGEAARPRTNGSRGSTSGPRHSDDPFRRA